MQRIESESGQFSGGNPATNTKGTVVTAEWLNTIQEEIANVVENTGAALDEEDDSQLAKAIQSGALRSASAGGTADAITASFTPAIGALTNGMLLLVRAGAANTTPTPTFSPNSGAITATIVKGNNLPLVAGDIAGAGHWLALQYDSVLDKWVLLNPASPITGHGVQKFTSNGSFTLPPGINTIWVSGCAGGGGGGAGGCRPTTSLLGGGGSGGGAGQFCIKQPLSVVPGSVINVTIGGAGAGGVPVAGEAGNNGTAGGNTSIGAYISLAGGGGGVGGGGGAGSGGGRGVVGYPVGNDGSDGLGGGTGNGGMGASGPFGGGGGGARSTSAASAGGTSGRNAGGYGAGGGGGSSGIDGAGGAGSPGLVIIEW